LKKNDEIELNIHGLSVEGCGIGRHEGMAVFVPRALPGETVSAKIIKLAKNYAAARMEKIIKASGDRVKPFCPVFERCGGCTLQHLSYPGQLRFKSAHIKDCFRRIGGIEIDEPDVIPSENIYGYRNKASFPVCEINGKAQAGFYAPRSHRIVAADCPIQKPVINEIKNAVIRWANENNVSAYDEATDKGVLRHIIGRQSSSGEAMAGVVVREKAHEASLVTALGTIPAVTSVVINRNEKRGNVILGDNEKTVFGKGYLTEDYDGIKFRVGLSSFLQVNHPQSERLYETALEFARITDEDTVYDLFCGVGTISLLAAKRAKRVIGIEYAKSAVDDARKNAETNGVKNAVFFAGDAAAVFPEAVSLFGNPDIIILDPPRKGCGKPLLEEIARSAPRAIVYVSCDPATLARDAALLSDLGYGVAAVKGVDMFPHTTHVECCCLLMREKNREGQNPLIR